jgi:hypothetical protein
MKTQSDYQRALKIVGEVVRAWDPYSLLENGAPSDEFDPEIALLVARIASIRSAHDATQAVSSVFSAQFEPGDFPVEACAETGAALYARLVASGLTPPVEERR